MAWKGRKFCRTCRGGGKHYSTVQRVKMIRVDGGMKQNSRFITTEEPCPVFGDG